MDTQTNETAGQPVRSAREYMRQQRAQEPATLTTKLPRSGLAVTYPANVTHDKVLAAGKMAGKNRNMVGKIIVAQTCLFEGERWTVDEVGTLLHNADVVHLISLTLGSDDDEEGGSGN